ncbi:MAG: sigma-70 family RNA polymerase sigma factor [Pyrinomonadaceae bacterium]|nr:sigma-70 family RNA polymerase sigma factor [Pyrinomonadaceae bacterium]
MDSAQSKHLKTIEESVAALISRAENSRGLSVGDISSRVTKAVDKYVLKIDSNADRTEIKSFIDGIRGDDLCLVIACERGDEAAWADLVQKFDSTVKSAAYNFCKNKEDAEDLAGSIWAELHGLRVDQAGKKKSKLSYYSGRGSLGGWLRAVTNQLAIDEIRKNKRLVQTEDDREFEILAQDSSENSDFKPVVSLSADPESIFSSESAERDISAALKASIEDLESEDKLILKLYYFDDLNLKDIGAALGFHEATASRKVVRIQNVIRKSVEKYLEKDHGWTKTEIDRTLTENAEKLGLNVESLFRLMIFAVLVQEIFNGGVL